MVTAPDFEAGLDEGHEGLVFAEGEGGLEQEALGVAELGVQLHVGVGIVVGLADHAAEVLGDPRLAAEPVDGVACVAQHGRGILDMFLEISKFQKYKKQILNKPAEND